MYIVKTYFRLRHDILSYHILNIMSPNSLIYRRLIGLSIFSDVHMNCIIKLMTNSIFTGFHLSGEVSPGEGSAGDQERMKVSVSFDR